MRFTVGGAAEDGCADAGSVGRIDEIHVQREVESGGAVACDADGFLHHTAEAALVDLAHGEGANTAFAYVRFFELVDVAQTDDDDIARVDLAAVAEEIAELGGAHAGETGE